jgi:subtilisin family serine protease
VKFGLSRLSILLVACVGVTGTQIRAKTPITWVPAQYEISLFPGTVKSTTLTFESTQSLNNVSLFVAPAISGFISIGNAGNVATFPAGAVASIAVRIEVPAATPVGDYEGTIHVRSGQATIPNTLKVLIHIVQPSSAAVPTELAFPSSDRIAVTEGGVPVVQDEVVIGLEFDLPNQDQLAQQIAQSTNGLIIGSSSALTIYQIRYAVADMATLERVRSALAGIQHVEFATFHFFSSTAATPPPNDPRFLDGSQWGLNYIGAPQAWSVQTGSTSVIVGVIDRDFDAGHPDLKMNVATPILPPPNFVNSQHGTHVAGVAGAVGNNGIGVTGIAWRTSLRLYECGSMANLKSLDILCLAGSMAAAAEDGARIVNLSSDVPGAI